MTDPCSSCAKDVRFWSIVPAAGLGRRMGADKQAIRYRGSTLCGTVVRTLLSAGVDGVVVVTRGALREKLDLPTDPRVTVAINDCPDAEMIDSIRIGLRVLASAFRAGDRRDCWESGRGGRDLFDGVVVIPGDMPRVTSDSVRRCLGVFAIDPSRIIIASHGGRRGHPLIFPCSLSAEVHASVTALNQLASAHPELVRTVETNDDGTTYDLDYPEDLRGLENPKEATFGTSLPGREDAPPPSP